MIDHIGFPVSNYERSKVFYLKALAPLDYVLVMEVKQEGILPPVSAPMASRISGSAAKADWTSRCMSRSWPRTAPRSMLSTRPRSRPAGAITARRAYVRIIIRTITARSCSILMGTTSKPSAIHRRDRFHF